MNDNVLGKRKVCSRCKKRRIAVTHWQDTGVVLCKPCGREPGVAFAYSVRGKSR